MSYLPRFLIVVTWMQDHHRNNQVTWCQMAKLSLTMQPSASASTNSWSPLSETP